MDRRSRFAILLLVFGMLLGMFPVRATAQCFGGLPSLGSISGMTGNPFQAEVKHTFLTQNTSLVQGIEPRTEHVARDSHGRLRMDWSIGKYKLQNGPDAGTEQEQHRITICDPVRGEWISLDTLNETATIQKVNSRSTPSKAFLAADVPSFCSRQLHMGVDFPSPLTEDLGYRTIEGIDAHGVLAKHMMQNGFSSGTTTSVKEITSETETWCSEELGAIILRVIGTAENGKTQTVMVNIQRGEPDESLFQIPPNFRVAERVNNSSTQTGMGVVGSYGFGGHAVQTPPPNKP